MSTRGLSILIVLTALALAAPRQAPAQKRPIQLSLVHPVQIFPKEDTIAGVRIDLIYGRNAAVYGLDVGIVNHTTEISKGFMWGAVGIAEEFRGWQNGYVNIAKGRFEGFQSGIVNVSQDFAGFQDAWVFNHAKRMGGFQAGLVNYAGTMKGFQLGLVNYAGTLKGLQIGLANIIAKDGMLPFFPIFNLGL